MSFDPDDPNFKTKQSNAFDEILKELQKIVALLSILTDTEIKD